MPTIAPWLQAPDVAADFARGAQIGAQIASEKARLALEGERLQMESQIHQDTVKRETLLEQARIQTTRAYNQARIGLQQARLEDVEKENQVKLRRAATAAMAHQRLAGLIDSGMPLEKALLQVPELATPRDIVDAHKMALDLGTQRLEQRKIEDTERQSALEARTQRPVETGEDVTETTDPDNPNVKKTSRVKRFGTPGATGQVITHRFDPDKGLVPVGGQ